MAAQDIEYVEPYASDMLSAVDCTAGRSLPGGELDAAA